MQKCIIAAPKDSANRKSVATTEKKLAHGNTPSLGTSWASRGSPRLGPMEAPSKDGWLCWRLFSLFSVVFYWATRYERRQKKEDKNSTGKKDGRRATNSDGGRASKCWCFETKKGGSQQDLVCCGRHRQIASHTRFTMCSVQAYQGERKDLHGVERA